MSIAIIDMICYHTKNKNMLEYQIDDISNEDMKDLVERFFDFHNKQCTVKADKYGNFFIERDDIGNGRLNGYYACLKKIIFKKNGNIDVEMCIGDNKTSYTVEITEYTTIQPTNYFCQEYNIMQSFNWKNLNQGELTEENVLQLFNNSVKDQQAFSSFKNTLIKQISTVFKDKINQKLNQELCCNEQKNNSLMSVDVPMINTMMANDGKGNNINQNIHQDANVNPPACDALEAEIKQTLEEFMSDIEVKEATRGKADIVIKNKSFVVKNNNKITLQQINISPNNMMPSSKTDVKFNIFINGKQYSISYESNILPFVKNGPMTTKVCTDFMEDVKNYLQDENNKKIFVKRIAEYVKTQIEKQIEKEKQINENNEEQNNNIINQKALNIIDKNKELRHENNNVITDKQKNPNENITNNAEDEKHTALNTNKNNENDTYHNEDHYIARKIRNCLSMIDCCDCLSLDTGSSMYWQKDNSPFIFK